MGAEALKNALNSLLQGWLSDHPALGWCVIHPLWTIALALLFLFLAWGLLQAFARLVETVWLALLRAPIQFSRWIFRQVINRFKPPKTEVEQADTLDSASSLFLPLSHSEIQPAASEFNLLRAAQLSRIVMRLEQLQKDQVQLLQDVQALLHPTREPLSHQPAIEPSQGMGLTQSPSPDLGDRS